MTNVLIYIGLFVGIIVIAVYFYKRRHQFTDKDRIIWTLLLVGLIVLYLFLAFNILSIDFTFQAQDSNVMYSVLNGLMTGGIFVLLGFGIGVMKVSVRVILLVVCILFSVLGGGFIGIQLCVNYFLTVSCWASNTIDGLMFFAGNWSLFLGLVILSFLTETEHEIPVEGKSG